MAIKQYLIIILMTILAITAIAGITYTKGYNSAALRCENEKNDLIIQHNTEKDEILSQIRQKSPVERRKELKRYVIY